MFFATGLPGWMRFGNAAGTDPDSDPQSARQSLQEQANALQSELAALQKRLANLDANSESE